MMINMTSPWDCMSLNSQRRVDYDLSYDFFWIVDIEGRYGFCIESKDKNFAKEQSISLKGIIVKKIYQESENKTKLYLVLSDNQNAEIFRTLCEDLINIANRHGDNTTIIDVVESRLKQWQQLLKNNSSFSLTIERQMGLFSELVCLKNNISKEVDICQAVELWVGPEFDKQDFLLDTSAVEVKSYRTSKGQSVHISSSGQLRSIKAHLYLIAYGLTVSKKGVSIADIVESIVKQIETESVLEKFEAKLFQYGYITGIVDKNNLYKFIIDSEKAYEVNSNFPCVHAEELDARIISIKYVIDLSKCEDFVVSIDSMFKKEGIA